MSALQHYIRVDQDPEARIFLAPSPEAMRLCRRLGWLIAPARGKETRLSRVLGALLVAPFTQLTLFSFDLQAFLYEVFHQRASARIGHFLGMPAVNFFLMAGLARVWPALGTAYAALLLVWYGILAHRTRMIGWWLVMVPVVLALCAGAHLYHGPNPWLGALASAALIALSHVPEPKLPPRVTGAQGWLSMREYIGGLPGERLSARERGARVLSLGVQFVTGTLNELVASPRLMPYGFLMRMFELGYRPHVERRLREHVARALQSGNPAIDYVGTGGGVGLNTETVA